MKNFIIFFQGREGTSPLVRLLDNFGRVSIVHQVDDHGWEPFDAHNCGPMPLGNLEECLDLILGDGPVDMVRLRDLYMRTGTRPLDEIDGAGSVGFKMRFQPPVKSDGAPRDGLLRRLFGARRSPFQRMMFDALKRNDVVVFLAVRQDLLRWGLSRYHGDGTGKAGHIQFKLARGEISRDEIGAIHVDCDRLADAIAACEDVMAKKRELVADLERAGIRVHALRYEDFLADKPAYFRRVCDILELGASDADIEEALARGAYFEKVHSDNLADFVENHEEVTERFGNLFASWD